MIKNFYFIGNTCQVVKKSVVKKESKGKRENEESKENLKAKSDDSGEEKNADDESPKNGQKRRGVISIHSAVFFCLFFYWDLI